MKKAPPELYYLASLNKQNIEWRGKVHGKFPKTANAILPELPEVREQRPTRHEQK